MASKSKTKHKPKTKTQSAAPKVAAMPDVQAAPMVGDAVPVVDARDEVEDAYWPLALAILIAGILLRQIALAAFPFHPDEAIHAWFPLSFDTYRFDPIYHGPALYFLTATIFTFFNGLARIFHLPFTGDNDYAARLGPSLLGIGLLVVMLYGPLRRWIGPRGALWSAALVALSPVIVTYSRRLLHDSLVLLLTLGAILYFQKAREHRAWTRIGRQSWLGVAALLSLFVATKANSFFIIAMLIGFWLATVVQNRFVFLRQSTLTAQLLSGMPLGLFVVVSVASFFALRVGDEATIQSYESRLKMICLVCTGLFWIWLLFCPQTIVAPFDEADAEAKKEKQTAVELAQPSTEARVRRTRRDRSWRSGLLSAWAALLIFAFFYGHGNGWWRVPVRMVKHPGLWAQEFKSNAGRIRDAALHRAPLQYIEGRNADTWTSQEIVGITTPEEPFVAPPPGQQQKTLTGSQDWDDATMALPRMLYYWSNQQQNPRLAGRHDYYLTLFPLYELPIFLLAIPAIFAAGRKRGAFTDLLLWWAFTSWVLYAVANEKVPWLMAHMALPLAILGGWWLGQLPLEDWLHSGREIARGTSNQSTLGHGWKVRALVVVAVLSAIFSLRSISATNFERAGVHREPMFYAQISEEFRDAWFASVNATPQEGTIWVQGEKQWPLAWYGRSNGPGMKGSGAAFGTAEPDNNPRFIVTSESDWSARKPLPQWKGWQATTVDHYIWPRPSWPALRPDTYWRWWLDRIATPDDEKKLPMEEWKHSILHPPGEWSNSTAVFATPPKS